MKSPRLNHGFTIVELLIVVVVIAILASITIVSYNGIVQRARVTSLQSDLRNSSTQLEIDKLNNGTYPITKEAANNGTGLKTSQGTTLEYTTPYGTDNGYCLTASNSTVSYYLSSANGSLQLGKCTGHTGTGVALGCPSNYIVVPGNSTFGTSDFCVMKYEAKNVSGAATSQAAGTPWGTITQSTAITTAQAACSGCHLITEAEWMTIAANVLSVPTNWSSGVVGTGYIYSGHNDNSPASALAATTTDSDGYNGTGNSSGNQRRTLTLTNNQVIWDLAGNVSEWTSGTIGPANMPGLTGDSGFHWNEFTDAALLWGNVPATSRPSAVSAQAATWNSSNGVGGVYSNRNETTLVHPFARGGYFGDDGGTGLRVGVLTLALSSSTSTTSANIGFRVAK